MGDEIMDCVTCGAYLGGGCCRDNLEGECRDGGHEAWRARTRFVSLNALTEYCDRIHGAYTGFEAKTDGQTVDVVWR